MTTYCPTLSGDAAISFTSGGYNLFMNLAPRAFEETQRLAQQLNAVLIRPVDFNVSFDLPPSLAEFRRPERPAVDFQSFALQKPADVGAPPVFAPRDVALTPIPEQDLAPPTLSFGQQPALPNIAEPVPPPPRQALPLPTAPNVALPALPTFEQLNLPAVPAITLPTFQGQRPEFVEPYISGDWHFEPERYASALKDKLLAKLATWMEGQEALPPQIEETLFARGRARIEIETEREIAARIDEWGSRGFTEPGGALIGSIDALRQTAMDKKAELNRDLTIKMAEEALQNLRLAVQQGIAFEQVATSLHIQEQGLILQGMQFQRETAIAVLNARISIFNARLQAYQTDAQVLAETIRAELAKVELYRAQLEGERAKGELNEQKVRIYAEQLRGLNALIDFYRGQVEAVKVQADVQKNEIEVFRAEVDAYGTRWKAYADQWAGYKASIEAETAKVTVHRNLVDAFNGRLEAWGTQNKLYFDRERLRMEQHTAQLQAWRGTLERMQALLQAEVARVQSVAQGAQAAAQIYTADAGVEAAASAAQDRTTEIALRGREAKANLELKQAEIRIQENLQITQLLVEVRKMLAQVQSQLTASAMSAMNFSASVGSSRSVSQGCSTSYSWSGEAPDL